MPDRIILDEILDMQAAGRLAALLKTHLHPSDPPPDAPLALELDARNVSHVSALAAQVLLSAFRRGTGPTERLVLCNPSPSFTEGLQRLGIDPDLLLT